MPRNLNPKITLRSIQSISSLATDDVFKNRNFANQLVDSLKNSLDNQEMVDIELISGTDDKR
jgi:hypothetical protein